MPDNIVLSTLPRPQTSWFSGAQAQQAPVNDALSALTQAATSYSLSSIANNTDVNAQVMAELENLAQPESVQEKAPQNHEQATQFTEDLDYELIVGSLLDDITSVIDDVREHRLALNDQLVDLLTKSFQDIARHLERVPEHLAVEVGELGAEVCDVIEARGTSAEPIISLFNP